MTLNSSGSLIIFYDSNCLLCQRGIHFLLRRDRKRIFRYASLEGETAKQLLPTELRDLSHKGSLVVRLDNGRSYLRSNAVLCLCVALGGGWKYLAILYCVPAFIRDGVYRFISYYRHRLPGNRKVCHVLSHEDRLLFLP